MHLSNERGDYKKERPHKATVGRIIADVKTGLDERERNIPKLEQQRKKLREKYEVIRKLDGEIRDKIISGEIQDLLEAEDEVSDEIELTLILLEEALTAAENARATATTHTEPAGTETRNQPTVDGSLTRNPMTELVLHPNLHQSLTESAPLTR